jgi:hypothetical protein
MHKCPTCGAAAKPATTEPEQLDVHGGDEGDDDKSALLDEILAEIPVLFEGGMAKKLGAGKKPIAIEIEAGPDDDEDEEDGQAGFR